jgi:predicted DNA-binding WGR domain protein
MAAYKPASVQWSGSNKMASIRQGVERYFEANGTGSNGGKKFWAVTLKSATIHIRFGKVGTKGSHRETAFSNEHAAESSMQSLIQSKLAKGYAERDLPAPAVKQQPGISYASAFAAPLPGLPPLADVPRPSRASELPGLPSAPSFMALDLDEGDDEGDEGTPFESMFELDSEGATLYRHMTSNFEPSKVILSSPLLWDEKSKAAAFLFSKAMFELFGKTRKVNIHRILGSDELRVTTGVYEDGFSLTERKALHVKMRVGETVPELYQRIAREFSAADLNDTLEEDAYFVEIN